MGHKVHPKAFRLGTIRTWSSRWFARRKFPEFLKQDVQLRDWLLRTLREASVDRVEIERSGNNLTVAIYSAKPGFIIGRAGTGAEELKRKIGQKFFRDSKIAFQVNIMETPRASLQARILAEQVSLDIEKRLPFRRVMKQVIDRIEKSGAKGGRIRLAGRLGGAEIARKEQLSTGSIPLGNLRADVDFGQATAYTVYGTIGVKVWIYRGEVFLKTKEAKG